MAGADTEDSSESGVGHSSQVEVADLQRQVSPFAVRGISDMESAPVFTS